MHARPPKHQQRYTSTLHLQSGFDVRPPKHQQRYTKHHITSSQCRTLKETEAAHFVYTKAKSLADLRLKHVCYLGRRWNCNKELQSTMFPTLPSHKFPLVGSCDFHSLPLSWSTETMLTTSTALINFLRGLNESQLVSGCFLATDPLWTNHTRSSNEQHKQESHLKYLVFKNHVHNAS